ncbi:protein GLUTAMINE DUMPER 6-like [Punica granatum]|uniref:Uncharacterized protein n=2 Tax=Punica granatum TaxID=22663 RepID=A0A218XHK8_PUNGR|nr:protein GLUTAMINE DUMPER 6-like [Punica granatum]OWM84695.1 hypothetical protein CDL15_Pgr027482 [Punica granatum]PKI69877.1 hypothetical protein CRG98_009752 [Punica granatum]
MANTPIWSSPIPYLFGGLGLVLILIAVALIILGCSYKKRSSSSQVEVDDQLVKLAIQPLDMEPRIVVIMAGDDKPTHLAKPVPPQAAAVHEFPTCCCDQVELNLLLSTH